MKTFMISGLDLYITGVNTKEAALVTAFCVGWLISKDQLIEVERYPEGLPVYGPISVPEYEPGDAFVLDPHADY